jgi:hypothetical protein
MPSQENLKPAMGTIQYIQVKFEETISKRVKSILACQPENSEALQGNWQPDTRYKDADGS